MSKPVNQKKQQASKNTNNNSITQHKSTKSDDSRNSSRKSSFNKKNDVAIPPPLIQVDFGTGNSKQKSKGNNVKPSSATPSPQQVISSHAERGSIPAQRLLPNGDVVSFNSNKAKNYQHQSLADGRKPDFGHSNNNRQASSSSRSKTDSAATDLLNMVKGKKGHSGNNGGAKNKNPGSVHSSARASPVGNPVGSPAYAGNSFNYSSPSAISLPKPTF